MLYCDNDILIFDEPTAVLTPQEIHELMKVMKQLVAEGKSIIFITHKLNEIKEVANRCSVLRKGEIYRHDRCGRDFKGSNVRDDGRTKS